MALIVEDGTGLADAESYCTLAFATGYHAARGNASWAAVATDAAKEALLRKATDFMVQAYRMRWDGYRLTATQALDWPRALVMRRDRVGVMSGYSANSYYEANVVPPEVQRACAELGLRAITVDLAPDQGRVTIREKIDVLEFEYAQGSLAYTQFRAVEELLATFFGGAGKNSARVLRV